MALFPARDPIARPHLTDWAQGSGSRIGIALVALAAKGDEGLVGVAEAGLAAVDPHVTPQLHHRTQATRPWHDIWATKFLPSSVLITSDSPTIQLERVTH